MGSELLINRLDADSKAGYSRLGMILLALCVAFPFVGQAFPYGLPLFGPIVILTLLVIIISRLRVNESFTVSMNIGLYGCLLSLVLMTYLYGIVRTDYLISSGSNLVQDLLNGFETLLLCLAAVNINWNKERLTKFGDNVIILIFVISVGLSIAGVYKFILLQKGVQIPFILSGNPDRRYPWGSSLVEDYNSYALALLCGIIAAAHGMVVARKWWGKLVQTAGFLIMILAGFLSGSRRFWVLAPLLIMLALFWFLKKEKGPVHAIKWVTLIILGLIFGTIYFFTNANMFAEQFNGGLDVKLRFASMLASQDSYGFADRITRFDYALRMLDMRTVLFGRGFNYLSDFGCKYGQCVISDYPHNPILSAFLYGGIVSAAIAIIFSIDIIKAILNSIGGSSSYLFFGLSLAAAMVFSSISGNTVLSSKPLLVIAIVCMLYDRLQLKKRT